MVVDKEGVVYDVPVAKLDPPLEAAYQLIVAVPLDAAAERETVPASQRLAEVAVEIVGIAFTVATTAVLALVQLPRVAET